MLADRAELRSVFFRAWERFKQKQPLEGAESLVVQVALRHPEYREILDHPEAYREHDYLPDAGAVNPFLHLSLHIALEEQIELDRPRGIRAQYQQLCLRTGDDHRVQHRLIDCLAETLWQAGRAGMTPDETSYLRCIEQLGARG
ncbi:MAG: DUF1841 family protein [Acidiferrobacteraceae bacterium]